MEFDFDRVIDRRGTDSLQVDFSSQRGRAPDLLPLWLADMGFQAPPAVLAALRERIDHGIFGYCDPGPSYLDALTGWLARRHAWNIEADWVLSTPGTVYSLHVLIRALTEPGDGVVIMEPVYYPFRQAIRHCGARAVINPLSFDGRRYGIDLDRLEADLTGAKLLILCSPHNPVGRVWSEAELRAIGQACLRHGVLVIADEVHADFVYRPARHLVFANLAPEFGPITLTCTGPSKTFNLAGLQLAHIIISDLALRLRVEQAYDDAGYSQRSGLGIVAGRAAYQHGDAWLDALLAYLDTTRQMIAAKLAADDAGWRSLETEGTFLAWLDGRGLGLEADDLASLVADKARLWLDDGRIFGQGGAGFQRLNYAVPRQIVTDAIERLCRAAA